MKSTLLSLLLAAACTSALATYAAELSEGEIRKIDKDEAV